MRQFPYITAGRILSDLRKDGLTTTRVTFYKLEKEGLFASRKTAGGWRIYKTEEAELIKKLIRENYGITPKKSDS